MTTKNANTIRTEWAAKLAEFIGEENDVGYIASGTINFPVVVDGEEGFVEIVVKVPKETEDDDGYTKREAYRQHNEEKALKKAEADRKKAEKIEKDRKAREAKAKARAEKKGE